jgi:serine/threonine protein phosphatase 1
MKKGSMGQQAFILTEGPGLKNNRRTGTMARMTLPVARFPVRFLPLPPRGRAFIVADLFGQRTPLLRLLDHVRFDPVLDQLFSVGNLVDRGPDSLKCLQLLTKPWFFACLGDREAQLLAWLRDPSRPLSKEQAWLSAQAPTAVAQRDLANTWGPLLEALPAVWVVGADTERRFQVVHAELFKTGGPLTHERLDGWQFDQPDAVLAQAMTGRTLAAAWRAQQPVRRWFGPGFSPIYGGHTVVPRASRLACHVFLNMGAGLIPGITPETDEQLSRQPPIHPGVALIEAHGKQVWWTPSDTKGLVRTMPLAELDTD